VTLSRPAVRDLLTSRGLAPRRDLGQNFVADPNTVRRIAHLAGVGAGDHVLEIGAGLGSLTIALADTGAAVTAVEVDHGLVGVLAEVVGGYANVTVVEADATRLDWATLLGDHDQWVLVANLPYNIATPLVADVLDGVPAVRRMLVMVQREVAERLAARPKEEGRSLLSVLIQLHATVRRRFGVPAGAFVPPPKVDSAVVEIVPDAARAERARARPQLTALLKFAFQARRKTLRRGLADHVDEAALARAPAEVLARRPEELSEEEWLALADVLGAPSDACAAG